MYTIVLLTAFMEKETHLGLGAQATQQCYVCSGFDANKKTDFHIKFVEGLQKQPLFPKPIEDQCITKPNSFAPCNSICVTAVVTYNVEHLGAFEMGTSDDAKVLDSIRAMGTGRVAIRTCLDTLLNSTGLKSNKTSESLKMLELGKEEICINGELEIGGVNTEGEICFCQTDLCNKKQPKKTIAPADVPQPIDDNSFTATCPPRDTTHKVPKASNCTRVCTSDSSCLSKKQLCCDIAGCGSHCANPVYNKKWLRDLFENGTKGKDFSKSPLPPLSKECFNQPVQSTKKCQTLAYAFGLQADYTGFEKEHPKEVKKLMDIIKNSVPMKHDASATGHFGKSLVVARGCAEDTFPMAFSSGFPKVGPITGTVKMDENIMGIDVKFDIHVCNKDKCNMFPIAQAITEAYVSAAA